MSLHKFALALALAAVLGAVFASSAFAGTSVTDPAAWVKTEGGVKKTITEENIKCGLTEGAPPFILKSKVLGSSVEITATGFNCKGWKIWNHSETEAGGQGQFEFTGVTVDKPAGCKTPSTLKTNALVGHLTMDKTVTTKQYLKFTAQVGETIANLKLEGCAAAGNYPIKGCLFFEATDPTDVHTVRQEFASNETTHAMSTTKLGAEPATLTGEFWVELESGLSWGSEEP